MAPLHSTCRPHVRRRLATRLLGTITIAALVASATAAQAPHDAPAGAIAIGVGLTPVSTFNSTPSGTGVAAACGSPAIRDVWYKWTPAFDGDARINCSWPALIGVYTGGPVLTPVSYCWVPSHPHAHPYAPFSGQPSIKWRAVAGTTYYFRVGTWTPQTSAIWILLHAIPAPPNDLAAGALALVAGANSGTTKASSASDDLASCPGSTKDVWYKWEFASHATATVTLTGNGANRLGVYAGAVGSMSPVGNCWGPAPTATTPSTISWPAVPGTYYVRVGKQGVGTGAFVLEATSTPAPANDTPAFAFELSSGSTTVVTNGCTRSTSGLPSSCLGSFPDVWYRWTAAADVVATATLRGSTWFGSFITRLGVYVGTPSSLTPVDDCWTRADVSIVQWSALAGTTYYLRVFQGEPTFGQQLSLSYTTTPVSNDLPWTATPVTPGVIAGTTVGSTPLAPWLGTCLDPATPDVWFTWRPGVDAIASVSFSGIGADRIGVYRCFTNVHSLEFITYDMAPVSDPGCWSAPAWEAFKDATYYIRVGQDVPASLGPFTLTLVAFDAPPNHKVKDAIAVAAGVNPGAPNGASGATFTNQYAFATPFAIQDCGSGNRDVWFKFTSTQWGPTQVSLAAPAGFAPGTIGTAVLVVHSGSYAEPEIQPEHAIACAVGNLPTVSFDATPGDHFVRVGAQGSMSSTGSFYLTITPPPIPANDDAAPTNPTLSSGFNPGPPLSDPPDGACFTNVGASNSHGYAPTASDSDPCCAYNSYDGTAEDVFFDYDATASGPVTIKVVTTVASVDGVTSVTGGLRYPRVEIYGPTSAVATCATTPPSTCLSPIAAAGLAFNFPAPEIHEVEVTFPAMAGNSYVVRVGRYRTGYWGMPLTGAGKFFLHVSP